MNFENLIYGRIFLAIGIIFIVGFGLTVMLYMCYLMPAMLDAYSEVDPNGDPDQETAEFEARLNEIVQEKTDEIQANPPEVIALSAVQWLLTAAVTYFMAFRTARLNATSREQAIGYGVVIGGGALASYGFCSVFGMNNILVTLAGFGALVGAGYFGGKLAGNYLRFDAAMGVVPGATPGGISGGIPGHPGQAPHYPGGRPGGVVASPPPNMAYNMGVQAALGGRPDEARDHFKRVIQMNPRHIAAWLQLANLAQSPEDAWNYVQQARAIDASDPAVLEAVNVIWPQVAARARQVGSESPPTPDSAADDSAPRANTPLADAPLTAAPLTDTSLTDTSLTDTSEPDAPDDAGTPPD